VLYDDQNGVLMQKEKAIEVLADIPGVQKSDIKCALQSAPFPHCMRRSKWSAFPAIMHAAPTSHASATMRLQ